MTDLNDSIEYLPKNEGEDNISSKGGKIIRSIKGKAGRKVSTFKKNFDPSIHEEAGVDGEIGVKRNKNFTLEKEDGEVGWVDE